MTKTKSKYVNVPLDCLGKRKKPKPEFVIDKYLRQLGTDEAAGQDMTIFNVLQQQINPSFRIPLEQLTDRPEVSAEYMAAVHRGEAAPPRLSDEQILGFGSCLGVCQPVRKSKHVDSCEVEVKLLT